MHQDRELDDGEAANLDLNWRDKAEEEPLPERLGNKVPASHIYIAFTPSPFRSNIVLHVFGFRGLLYALRFPPTSSSLWTASKPGRA